MSASYASHANPIQPAQLTLRDQHFNPVTGELTISTMNEILQFELRHLLVNQLRAGASMVNPSPFVVMTLGETDLESEVAGCAIAIFKSISDTESTLVRSPPSRPSVIRCPRTYLPTS